MSDEQSLMDQIDRISNHLDIERHNLAAALARIARLEEAAREAMEFIGSVGLHHKDTGEPLADPARQIYRNLRAALEAQP